MTSVTFPPHPHRTWRSYTQATIREAPIFDRLLSGLTTAIPDVVREGPGRPPTPPSTLAWCAIKKAYTGHSLRRNQAFVADGHQAGHIRRLPGHNAVSDFLNMEETGALLRRLVRLSASPFSGIERDFAVDGTGFATGTYGTYRETRYGKINGELRKRTWVKLHACTGVLTNVVTDAVVLRGRSADSPQFHDLVAATAESFDIREVSADKAYSSKRNLHTVKELGGRAFIPFRGGKSKPGRESYAGGPAAKTWRHAWHFFQLHEDEFYEHYHKRSNVESAFSAIKRRFGERLHSKNTAAQFNEVLCKVAAYNVSLVARALVEGATEGVFKPSDAARLLGLGE